jgi:hypothetical protein
MRSAQAICGMFTANFSGAGTAPRAEWMKGDAVQKFFILVVSFVIRLVFAQRAARFAWQAWKRG